MWIFLHYCLAFDREDPNLEMARRAGLNLSGLKRHRMFFRIPDIVILERAFNKP